MSNSILNSEMVVSPGRGRYKTVHGLFDLLDRLDEAKVSGAYLKQGTSWSANGYWEGSKSSKDWAGVEGEKEYKEKLMGFENNHRNDEFLSNQNVCMDSVLTPSISGEFHDVGAYVQGVPECMADFESIEANRHVRVSIMAAVPAFMELRELQERASKVLEWVNTFEANKIRCEIVMVFGNAQPNEVTDWELIVKKQNENYVPHVHGFAIGDFATIRAAGYAYWSLFHPREGLGFGVVSKTTPDENEIVINYESESVSDIELKFKTFM